MKFPRSRAAALTAGLVVLCVAFTWVQGFRAVHDNGGDFRLYIETGRQVLSGTYWHDVSNIWPPFFSVFVVPAALLDRWIPSLLGRNAVVFAVNLALSVAFLAASLRALTGGRATLRSHALTWMLASPYLSANWYFHQINLVPALIVLLAFMRLDRRPGPLAGVLLGFAASLKVTPVLLVPLLARRPRILAACLLTGLLCALVPAAVYGPSLLVEATRFWLLEALPAHVGSHGLHNVSFAGALYRLFDPLDARAAPGVSTLVVALGTTACTRLGVGLGLCVLAGLYLVVWRGPRRRAVVDMALLAPAGVLTGNIAWGHHLVVMLPLFGALVVYLGAPDASAGPRRIVGWLTAGIVALTVAQWVVAIGPLEAVGKHLLALGSTTWCAYLGLAALAVARNDRQCGIFSLPEASLAGVAVARPEALEPSAP